MYTVLFVPASFMFVTFGVHSLNYQCEFKLLSVPLKVFDTRQFAHAFDGKPHIMALIMILVTRYTAEQIYLSEPDSNIFCLSKFCIKSCSSFDRCA